MQMEKNRLFRHVSVRHLMMRPRDMIKQEADGMYARLCMREEFDRRRKSYVNAYDEHINAIMIQNDVLGNARLEGMEEGRTKEKNNIARKMLANGLSIEQIATRH